MPAEQGSVTLHTLIRMPLVTLQPPQHTAIYPELDAASLGGRLETDAVS